MTHEDDVRAAYQGAIDMATHEGDSVWARFNVVLVANSIILLALTTSTSDLPRHFEVALSIGGLILCAAWLIVTKRGFTYETYYVISARGLEQKMAGGSIRTLSDGKRLSKGEVITIDGDKVTMSWLARLNARRVAYVMIWIFVAAYSFLIFKTVCALIIGTFLYSLILLVDWLLTRQKLAKAK